MSFANFMNKLISAVIVVILVAIIIIVATPSIANNLTDNQQGLITLTVTLLAVIVGCAFYNQNEQIGNEEGRRRIVEKLFEDEEFKQWVQRQINKTKHI